MEQEIKKPRERSKEYPQYTLKTCIAFTEQINTKLGNRVSSPEQLSKSFGKPITTLGGQLSACKQYGLLDLKRKAGYKPTDIFFVVTRGRTEELKRDAMLECLQRPTIYGEIIRKNNRKELPSDLPAIFYWDYKITENAKDFAAKIFKENLEDLNLISDNGFLFIEHLIEPVTEDEAEETDKGGKANKAAVTVKPPAIKIPLETNTNRQETAPVAKNHKRTEIKINPGRFVAVDFPEDITDEEVDKFAAKILAALKND